MPRFRRPRSPALLARRAGATLLAAFALVLALRPGPGAEAAAPQLEPVVVAARSLEAGRALEAEDLTISSHPPDAVPEGVVAEPELLIGRVLAGAVRDGEALTDARLVGPGLTSLLPAGQVAAPVRLADLAVAGLVRTGDLVDVLATGPDAAEAETLASGVRVLAAGGSGDDPTAGLLLVAVDTATAARLAAAATSATLTVSLPPP